MAVCLSVFVSMAVCLYVKGTSGFMVLLWVCICMRRCVCGFECMCLEGWVYVCMLMDVCMRVMCVYVLRVQHYGSSCVFIIIIITTPKFTSSVLQILFLFYYPY